jgi:hypothetical protein
MLLLLQEEDKRGLKEGIELKRQRFILLSDQSESKRQGTRVQGKVGLENRD